MGNRNMETTIANFKQGIPARYQLRMGEVMQLMELASSGDVGKFEAFSKCFDYGFILGCRAYKRGLIRGGI